MPEQERDGLAQELHKQALGKPEPRKEMSDACRRAGAEGTILLKNNGVLPLSKTGSTAFFGRVQRDYFYVGYGSGGDVNPDYLVSPMDALEARGDIAYDKALADRYRLWCQAHVPPVMDWGQWPTCHPEMPLSEEAVRSAAQGNDAAVVILGRAMGESMDNRPEPGGYYLTEGEKALLAQVTGAFRKVCVVVDAGNIMDLSWVEAYPIGALLYAFQGGMESGNALIDVLYGDAQPGGRLTDTVPRHYEDAPTYGHFGGEDFNEYREDIYVGYRWFETFHREQVRYPFGYGLSYTSFTVTGTHTDPLGFRSEVTNTGKHPGKAVVMLFVEKPCGVLGNPARELVAFGKTRLLNPGQSQSLSFSVTEYQLSSYDDSGITGHKSCYVLQQGAYRFYCGENVRDTQFIGDYMVPELRVLRSLSEACAPKKSFPIWANENGTPVRREASARTVDLRQRILDHLPKAVAQTGDQGIQLSDVKEGKASLEDFVAQLSLEELEAISRGAYNMDSPLGARGNAGVFGGVTQSLRDKGISPVTTTDGPSGIRLYDSCSLLPMGTLLASTFDLELVEGLYRAMGAEMRWRGSDVLLAPGMNIHRNPLCGRNFEYFSEDPYLTGRIAGAVVKGLQSQGVSACVKHFACNNQELNRNRCDSVVSERALREIYLKGFEICLKQAKPLTLMTSYNRVNGVWSHYNYDLVQTIAREEWGYEGMVMTDWWMQYGASPEFPKVTGNGYRVRGRVNVLMPGSRKFQDHSDKPDKTLLATYGKKNGITLGELQENAKYVLNCVMKLK